MKIGRRSFFAMFTCLFTGAAASSVARGWDLGGGDNCAVGKVQVFRGRLRRRLGYHRFHPFESMINDLPLYERKNFPIRF